MPPVHGGDAATQQRRHTHTNWLQQLLPATTAAQRRRDSGGSGHMHVAPQFQSKGVAVADTPRRRRPKTAPPPSHTQRSEPVVFDLDSAPNLRPWLCVCALRLPTLRARRWWTASSAASRWPTTLVRCSLRAAARAVCPAAPRAPHAPVVGVLVVVPDTSCRGGALPQQRRVLSAYLSLLVATCRWRGWWRWGGCVVTRPWGSVWRTWQGMPRVTDCSASLCGLCFVTAMLCVVSSGRASSVTPCEFSVRGVAHVCVE
jgi:hypothetical protein